MNDLFNEPLSLLKDIVVNKCSIDSNADLNDGDQEDGNFQDIGYTINDLFN